MCNNWDFLIHLDDWDVSVSNIIIRAFYFIVAGIISNDYVTRHF